MSGGRLGNVNTSSLQCCTLNSPVPMGMGMPTTMHSLHGKRAGVLSAGLLTERQG